MSFKIEKFLLRIAHFFNFRLGEEHKDDITINLPSSYPDNGFVELAGFNGQNNHYQWKILDDIFDQVYKQFEENPILEKKCRNVKYVLVTYYRHNIYMTVASTQIPYFDGVLYNPYDYTAYSREIKLNRLLNQ